MRIWSWTVTSSAVVGSSAIRSFGSAGERDGDQHALPHAAAESVRIVVEAPFGVRRRLPTSRSSMAAARACAPASRPCRYERLPAICRPMRIVGLSAVIGSWKIIAILAAADPRCRSARPASCEIAAFEADRAFRSQLGGRAAEEPDQRPAGDALAAIPISPTRPKHFAGFDIEADAVDGRDGRRAPSRR